NPLGLLGQIGGDDFDVNQVGSQRVLRDGVQQNLFVLEFDGLGNDQILVIGGQLGLRAGDIERRHGANAELLLVVVVKLLGNGHGFVLDLHICARVYEFPVSRDGIGDGGDGLQSESPIGDLTVVFRDAQVACINSQSKAVKQGLRKPDRERGLDGGIEKVGG